MDFEDEDEEEEEDGNAAGTDKDGVVELVLEVATFASTTSFVAALESSARSILYADL